MTAITAELLAVLGERTFRDVEEFVAELRPVLQRYADKFGTSSCMLLLAVTIGAFHASGLTDADFDDAVRAIRALCGQQRTKGPPS
ncbi:hypothetical protein [Polyangium sp. 15x6]|uniref:hypothetical protein n=1 Tax=Polyangium sp. 15x6 TaxID=3042687 RepID=UPI002499CBEE|nr:hypothetical protein [Polyangium sp. 15x6]MDI3285152.1 hypothetical protein [Polyangium sp. 15x6]